MISNFTDAYSSQLVSKGNFQPCLDSNKSKRVIEFSNFKKGWLVNFGMETFWGFPWWSTGPAPSPSYFNIPNVDVDNWVENAKLCNIQYAGITAITEFGFQLWNSEINFDSVNHNGLTPTHKNYNLNGFADQNIIAKFVTKFRDAGIEPFIYYNLSIDWNKLNNFSGVASTFAIDDARRSDLVLYWCLQCQELMIKYGIKLFWMDGFDRLTQAEYQNIYNACKSIDPECLIIMNAIGDLGLSQFPYDIGSTETSYVDLGSQAYASNIRSKNGQNYYIPQEIVISGNTTTSPQNWYNYDDLCVSPAPYPNLVLVTQEYYQSVFDRAKSAGASLLCAVMPDRYGKLYKPQIDLIKNLV